MEAIPEYVMDSLRDDEGYSPTAYLDSVGVWTIGYGTNLQAIVISQEQAEQWLNDKASDFYAACSALPYWGALDEVRRGVVASMAYQMGVVGLGKFKKFHQALAQCDYAEAAKEMLDSKWAKEDAPARAKRHAERMRTGRWNP